MEEIILMVGLEGYETETGNGRREYSTLKVQNDQKTLKLGRKALATQI